jgi:hypothetical protein
MPIRLIGFLLKFNFPGSDNLRRALKIRVPNSRKTETSRDVRKPVTRDIEGGMHLTATGIERQRGVKCEIC